MLTNSYSTNDLGYNKTLTKEPLFKEISEPFAGDLPNTLPNFVNKIKPETISSGQLNGNLNVVQGYLKSDNFQSGVNGWKFDAVGNLEANSGTFRGSIYATTGLIGGWTIESSRISQDNSYISSDGYISFGDTPPTTYGNNVGVWLGWSSGAKMSLYSGASNYLKWDGTSISIKSANFELTSSGDITATGGTIGGFTITSDALYGSTIKTGLNVAAGSNGVIMDTAGLRGYSSVLGEVFNLPTDGSAPTFSSGIINSTVFEINTNSVLRTSETVGDGSASSNGVLINNTGFYACGTNSSLEEANVRILDDGDAYFAGNVDASTITSSTITSSIINGAIITGGILQTASSGQRIEINATGMVLYSGDTGAAYGDETYKYNDTTRTYGTGVLAYINNSEVAVPLYFNAEQAVADIHFFNRSTNPSGAAEVGDVCVVNGRLMICKTAGTPGGWAAVGTEEAISSISPSASPSVSPSASPS